LDTIINIKGANKMAKNRVETKSGRFCFRQDDDSHWFLIPLEDSQKFEKLRAKGESDDWNEFNKAFEDMRSEGPNYVSFTDPKDEPAN
jgi:hypothetical protein